MPKFIIDIHMDEDFDSKESEIKSYMGLVKEGLDSVGIDGIIEVLEENTVGRRLPFGYKSVDGVNWIENKIEQKALEYMKRLRDAGESYRKISKLLNEEYDIKLSHSGVRNILNRKDEPKSRMIF